MNSPDILCGKRSLKTDASFVMDTFFLSRVQTILGT
jgi:hypothetical protein